MHVTAEEVIERLPHTQRRSVCPTLGNMTEDFRWGRYYDRRQRCPAFWVQLGKSPSQFRAEAKTRRPLR